MNSTHLINLLAATAIVLLSSSCSKESTKGGSSSEYPATIRTYSYAGEWEIRETKTIKWNWSKKPVGSVWPGKRQFKLPDSTLEILNAWHPVMLERIEYIKKQNNCSAKKCSIPASIPNSRTYKPWVTDKWKYVMFYNPSMRPHATGEKIYIDQLHEFHMRALGSFSAINKLPLETYAVRISAPSTFNNIGGELQGWESCNGKLDYSTKPVKGVLDECQMLNDYLWFNGKSEDNSDFIKWFNFDLLGLKKIVFKDSPLYVIVNNSNEIEYVIAPSEDIDRYNKYVKETRGENFDMLNWAPELTWTNSSNPYYHISFLKSLFKLEDINTDMRWMNWFYTDLTLSQITYPIGVEQNTAAIRDLQETATEIMGATTGLK